MTIAPVNTRAASEIRQTVLDHVAALEQRLETVETDSLTGKERDSVVDDLVEAIAGLLSEHYGIEWPT